MLHVLWAECDGAVLSPKTNVVRIVKLLKYEFICNSGQLKYHSSTLLECKIQVPACLPLVSFSLTEGHISYPRLKEINQEFQIFTF